MYANKGFERTLCWAVWDIINKKHLHCESPHKHYTLETLLCKKGGRVDLLEQGRHIMIVSECNGHGSIDWSEERYRSVYCYVTY